VTAVPEENKDPLVLVARAERRVTTESRANRAHLVRTVRRARPALRDRWALLDHAVSLVLRVRRVFPVHRERRATPVPKVTPASPDMKSSVGWPPCLRAGLWNSQSTAQPGR
jgi:hypothetical protein